MGFPGVGVAVNWFKEKKRKKKDEKCVLGKSHDFMSITRLQGL